MLMLPAFVGLESPHRCATPLDTAGWSPNDVIAVAVPPKELGVAPAFGQDYQPCLVRDIDYEQIAPLDMDAALAFVERRYGPLESIPVKSCLDGYVYNRSAGMYHGGIQADVGVTATGASMGISREGGGGGKVDFSPSYNRSPITF